MGILKTVGEIFGVVGGAVDEFHTSPEEKLTLKAKLLEIQSRVFSEAMELERAQVEAARDTIVAEAQSESWITRSWRPIVMLTFCVLIVMISFGWMDTEALNEVPPKLWSLMQIGIGGYIASRGAEKVIPHVAEAMKAREET
jgi:hypothetical protein